VDCHSLGLKCWPLSLDGIIFLCQARRQSVNTRVSTRRRCRTWSGLLPHRARIVRRHWLACALAGFLLALTAIAAVAAVPKRVLIVHSFGSAAPPFTTHSIAFETELTEKMGERVDLDEVSLDVARYATLDMEEALVEFMRKRQAKWQPDLVVPIGSPAGVFVAQYRDRLFPATTPIIYTGMDQRRLPPDALQQNAAFVGESFDFPGLVDDILQVAPATTNIAVVIGASQVEQYWTAAIQREFAPFTNRVSFTWFSHLSFDQMLEQSTKMPPRSFLLLILLMRDATGATHDADEALKRIHEVANAPVNGIFQHQLGLGIVGGRLYQAELEGVESARIAIRILHGEPASSFPPMIVGPLGPRYDWRELRRWKISEERLPRGSVVLFREPTVWEHYRTWIIAGISLCIAQALLIFGLLANLRKRRRAERSLIETEGRFRIAADSAPMMIWMSSQDKLCTYFNKPWLDFTGRTLEEELGNGWTEGVHPDDRQRCLKTYVEAFDAREPFETEYRLRHLDGEYRWISDTGKPRHDNRGNFAGYIGSCMDISERRRAEMEMQQQRQELAHFSRVSIMGELSASMAHELNQPLTAILTNARAAQRFLAAGQLDLGEFRAILKDIAYDTTRARDVILHVRALVKKGDQDFRKLDVDEPIRAVVAFLHGVIVARNGLVELELTPDLPSVHGDRIQLQQVFVNLILNAFDAMDGLPFPKRRVTISAKPESANGVRVSVRDCGTGIPPDKLETVFQPFYSTKPKGMGMGLSVTRSIVEAHGGRIWAENHAGGGAVFHVTLPAAGGGARDSE